MSQDRIQLVTDLTRVGVGSLGTATVWATNLDFVIRIGVGVATIAYLAVAIWHRLQHWADK